MKFKAGKYYIGDLCYVVSDDNWDKLLDETNYLEDKNISYKEFPIWCNSTSYGDGTYTDREGREYSVDAGIIGVMPVEAMDQTSDGGNIIEFKNDFETDYCDGIFFIGDITINTRCDEDEYEENSSWCNEEENEEED